MKIASRLLAAGFTLFCASTLAHAEKFSFVALGDTAYNPPADYATYGALIDKINAVHPSFSIHVGDTWGVQDCREPQQRRVLEFFQRYRDPIVYTPGDNEWVDCIDPEAARLFLETGGDPAKILKVRPDLAAFFSFDAQFQRRFADDGIARLADIRRVFFSKPLSLGQHPMPVVRQADVSDHHDFVENARWEKNGVYFGTVNVPGSGNDFTLNDETRAKEAIARNRANHRADLGVGNEAERAGQPPFTFRAVQRRFAFRKSGIL